MSIKSHFMSKIAVSSAIFAISALAASSNAQAYTFKKYVKDLLVSGAPTPGPTGSADIVLSTATITFPDTIVGNTASAMSVMVANNGTAAATLNVPTVTNSNVFKNLTTDCGTTLAVGQTCSISVSFAPVVGSLASATLSLGSNVGTKTVNVSGTGLAAVGNLAPASGSGINFGPVAIESEKDYTYIFTNTGTATATNVYADLNADSMFFASNNCGYVYSPRTLDPGQSCSFVIRFIPVDLLPSTGIIEVFSSAINGTQSLTLEGSSIGVANFGLSSSNINFAMVDVGSTATNQIWVINSGYDALTFTSPPSMRAGSSTTFNNLTTDCGTTLGAGQHCTVAVSFTPTAGASYSGTIDIQTSAQNGSVSLTGTGGTYTSTLAANDGSSTNFGAVNIGEVSVRTARYTNTGTRSLTGLYASVSSNMTIVTNSCGSSGSVVTLPAGGNCFVSVQYAPTDLQPLADATLTVHSGTTAGDKSLTYTGSSVGASNVVASTTSVSYAPNVSPTVVGTSNTSQSVIIYNTGNVAATVVGVGLNSGSHEFFDIAGTTCTNGLVLEPNSANSCTITPGFNPGTTEQATGGLTIAMTNGSFVDIALSGQAYVKTATLTADSSTSFGTSIATGTAVSRVFTLTNTSTASGTYLNNLTIEAFADSQFSVSSTTCNTTLAANNSCKITVQYLAAYTGNATSSLSVTSDASNSPVSLSLSASAVPYNGIQVTFDSSSYTADYASGGTTGTATLPATFSFASNGAGGMSLVSNGAAGGQGTGYISYPASANYAPGTGDVYIEARVYRTARNCSGSTCYAAGIVSFENGTSSSFELMFSDESTTNTRLAWMGNAVSGAASYVATDFNVVPLNTWAKVAIKRKNNTVQILVNDVPQNLYDCSSKGVCTALNTTIKSGATTNYTGSFTPIIANRVASGSSHIRQFIGSIDYVVYSRTVP